MKTIILLPLLIATGTILLSHFVDAELASREEFMKTYQPTLDRIHSEHLPPQKQLEIGILMRDVVCFDENHVQILKISSFNQVSCVTPQTAQNLVDRGWGMMHRDDPNTGKGGSECVSWWIMYDDGSNKPSVPQLIKTFRLTVNEFSNEYVVWSPVTLEDDGKGKTTVLGFHGSFDDSQTLTLKQNLTGVENVLNVKIEPRYCI
jgi:hypothetical protein